MRDGVSLGPTIHQAIFARLDEGRFPIFFRMNNFNKAVTFPHSVLGELEGELATALAERGYKEALGAVNSLLSLVQRARMIARPIAAVPS